MPCCAFVPNRSCRDPEGSRRVCPAARKTSRTSKFLKSPVACHRSYTKLGVGPSSLNTKGKFRPLSLRGTPERGSSGQNARKEGTGVRGTKGNPPPVVNNV